MIVGANGDLLINIKIPRAMLQENNPDDTCMSIPYVPGILLQAFTTYMPISKVMTTEILSLARMTNRHGHCVCWMSMGGKNSLVNKSAHSSVEHAVDVAAIRRLF